MLATRTLLSKQTLTAVSHQPACFVHQGEYGYWGNTKVAVDVDGGMEVMSMKEYSEYPDTFSPIRELPPVQTWWL
ncbi:hypothetical protein CCH79_00006904 [Gambusia affinis]|uniref:Uncharacterized protein n=1 Tax=Gambusia affinis TaxID=33528 RepID=A0A315VCF1_GAMAF|nr:hypothetical protein CCH79_00006904 [Gambusia affinis]